MTIYLFCSNLYPFSDDTHFRCRISSSVKAMDFYLHPVLVDTLLFKFHKYIFFQMGVPLRAFATLLLTQEVVSKLSNVVYHWSR